MHVFIFKFMHIYLFYIEFLGKNIEKVTAEVMT